MWMDAWATSASEKRMDGESRAGALSNVHASSRTNI
jgi:hypothetical protein